MVQISLNSIIPKRSLPRQISDRLASLWAKHIPRPTPSVVTTKVELKATVSLQSEIATLPKHEPEKDVFGIPRIELTGLDKVHQNLTKIFEKIRPVSNAEAEVMARRYKEIFKTENDTEYITKLFEQVKQDFGYGNNERIYLFRDDSPEILNFSSFDQNTGEMSVHTSLSRSDIFVALCHEFTHVKQHEIAFRTIGAKEKLVEKDIEYLKRLNPKGYIKDPESFVRCCRSRVDGFFEGRKRVFGYLPQFEEGSAEDILGRQYMDAEYYTTPEFYEDNLLEQEALRNGELAEEVFRQISTMK